MSIPVSQDFRVGWIQYLSGGATAEFNDDGTKVTLISPAGTQQGAMMQWRFPVCPGDIIEISVWARKTTGVAKIALDLHGKTNHNLLPAYYSEMIVEQNKEMKKYTAIIQVPEISEIFAASLSLGTTNSDSYYSVSEFLAPKINVKSSIGSSQCLAMGVIRKYKSGSNDMVEISPSFRAYGIKSVELTDNYTIKVYLAHKINLIDIRPIVIATGTYDNPYSVLVGAINPTDNSFSVKFTNGTGFVNLSTLASALYFTFSVLI